MLVAATASSHHGLLIFGIAIIVLSAFNLVFRQFVGRRDAALQQTRHDTAPGALKRLYPTRSAGTYTRNVTITSGIMFIVGIVVVIVSL